MKVNKIFLDPEQIRAAERWRGLSVQAARQRVWQDTVRQQVNSATTVDELKAVITHILDILPGAPA